MSTFCKADRNGSSWPAAAVTTAIALGILPLYAAELNVMAHISMYQFFPFVFVFIGVVGWTRWRSATGIAGPRASAGWWPETLCIATALLLLTVHAGLFGPWLGGVAGTVAAAAGVLVLRRIRNVQLWDLWALQAITMRLPLNLDGRLAGYLQGVSSRLSSQILDVLGVLHYVAGNIVTLPRKELFVDEACSGIISVASVIVCAAMLAIWRGRRLLHMVLLTLFGAICAMIMNVVRITAIATALAWYNVDWTGGWQHETISLASFLATFTLLISFDSCLDAMLAPIPMDEPIVVNRRGVRRLAAAWNWLRRLHFAKGPTAHGASDNRRELLAHAEPPWLRLTALAGVSVVLGGFHSFALYAHYVSATADADHAVQRLIGADHSGLERSIAPWKVEKAEFVERDTLAELGRYSHVYHVKHPSGTPAVISI
ncbi:MAG: exosortase/archaeosortase family protein, partial [Pirellulales bacterium]|nr:exosortase/archaeosortase family protein [Pirellulales bacterium]